MKNLRLMSYGLFLVGITTIASCDSSSSGKLKEAKVELNDAKDNLAKAEKDYAAELEDYRKNANATITSNERSIKEFKARIPNGKINVKAEYQEKIKELEEKNTAMKQKLNDYTVEGKDQWEVFKAEFSNDMDALGKAIKNLTVNNVK
ncbi:sll1863 family stress response protein [Fulvivirga lutea]|uniref:Uncharacterized protein n=1 Tax=Fulvivirga lutea TaxID=2810512 RepID=A0A974ZZS0_9BACT|nr:hypothetical protein [Fulvivirga lutea]QSE96441.1 hypothetical protein JR347_12615 [Fulvivirga lutea]